MRTKLKSLLLAGALCASTTAFAQGIIQFDWQGDQNLYQASFQVNATDYALGWPYSPYNTEPPALMNQTLTVTTPDHVFGPVKTDPTFGCLGWTETPPEFWHRVTLTYGEDRNPTLISLVAIGTGNRAEIYERPEGSGPMIRGETGTWIISVVPEPSCAALLGLGLLGLCMRRATSRV